MNIAPGKPVALSLMTSNAALLAKLSPYLDNLKILARLSSLNCIDKAPVGAQFATAEVKDITCFIDLADLIDMDAEKERLRKEKMKLEQEIAKCKSKLDNPQFKERAPVAVVEQETARLAEFSVTLEKVEAKLKTL